MSNPIKRLELKLYGSVRDFGDIPSAQHTDIRTIVKSVQRELSKKGRQFSLSDERITGVDLALKNSNFGSLQGLKKQMQEWYEGAEWGAQTVNEWYTEERAVAYHAHNQVSQSVLARASARMSGITAPLLLDLGCGSGLSSQTFLSEGFASFVIGIDLSEGMLRTARKEHRTLKCDWILADMSQPLPFKNGTFDGALSIGVLHYLLQEAEGHGSEERLRHLFTSIRQCVKHCAPVVFQFFPRREEQDARYILYIARSCDLVAELICDQSYHTQTTRWFLWVCPSFSDTQARGHVERKDITPIKVSQEPCESKALDADKPPGSCALFHPRHVLCCLSLVDQTQSRGHPVPNLAKEHVDWLQNEHIRFARQLIRKLNNLESEAGSVTQAEHSSTRKRKAQDKSSINHLNCDYILARRLRDRYGAHISTEDLKKIPFNELFKIMH